MEWRAAELHPGYILLSIFLDSFLKIWDAPGVSVVEHLPLAQIMIPESWDRVPHRAPHEEPASPSAYVSASLCVSHE